MARYGKKAATKVRKAMRERKKGTLKSGRSEKTVKSRKQAIAIGLSQARRSGGKVPAKKKSTARKSGARKGPARKKSSARKSAARKKTPSKKTAASRRSGRASGRKAKR
ncbi:MAG: DUF6496 domain-containing protein [Panacagrimonas sp.]